MRFALTDDQLALRGAVRELLGRECPPEVVRAGWPGGERERVDAVWSKLAEMGVPGAALPESAGGLGLGACDVVPLLEEAGRAALPLPVSETVFVGGPLLTAAGEPAAERIAAGELLVACALDGGAVVPHAERAGAILLAAEPGGSVRLLEGGEAAGETAASIDGARAPQRLADPGAGRRLDLDAGQCAEAWRRGALGCAAQLLGLGRTLLAMSTEYATERRQFGVPIGSFQAVKHMLADCLLGLEFASPAVLRAAWSLDAGAATAERDVAMAKALASEAAERAAATALQCHGAIGYTTEYDLHLFAKRVWASSRTWGGAAWQRARVRAELRSG